jgi:hypothetical protein
VSQELGGASRTGVTVRYNRSSALADAPAGRFGEGSQGRDHGSENDDVKTAILLPEMVEVVELKP